MLGFNLKQADKVDLQKPLLAYCEKCYGKQLVPTAQSVVAFVDNSRQAVVAATADGNAAGTQYAFEAHGKYLAALQFVESRFPIGELKGQINVKFTWKDVFKPKVSVSSTVIAFEKCSVLLNMANLLVKKARDADVESDIGAKEALQDFQSAAGIYVLLKTQLLPPIIHQISKCVDLSDRGLDMCIATMMAQAMALFYQTAVKQAKQRSLLAKLAMQVSKLYEAAQECARGLEKSVDASWYQHFTYQTLAYRAAATFQQALADEQTAAEKLSGYGKVVSRLKKALEVCTGALQLARQINVATDSLEALQNTVRAKHNSAEKDNRTVYLEPVPNPDTLEPITLLPAVPVKANVVTVADLVAPHADVLRAHKATMDQLTPQEVRVKAGEYTARAEKMVAEVEAEYTRASNNALDVLAEKGLPLMMGGASVSGSAIPEGVWSRVAEVQRAGGVSVIQAAFVQLTKSADECQTLLTQAADELAQEEEEDRAVRARFQGAWARPASDALNTPLRDQIKAYREKLFAAIETNKNVENKVEAMRAQLPLMVKSREELDALAPPSGSSVELTGTANLKSAIDEVNRVRDIATEKLQQYKTAVLQDTSAILGSLAEAHQAHIPMNAKIDEELGKFTTEKAAVVAAVNAIGQALPAVAAAEEAIKREQNMMAPNPHMQWLQDLGKCADTCKAAHADTNEGLSFFARLLEYSRTILQQAGDFVYARSEEKASLLAQIQRQIAQGGAPSVQAGGYPQGRR
jgi:programmed cell death 6-interacting protein